MDDNTKADILVDNMPPGTTSGGLLGDIIQAVTNLITPSNTELISLLRIPTPVKIARIFTISATGTLGGSASQPDMSQIIWTSPISAESWLNRIMITCPEHGPASPIVAPAELALVTSQGMIIMQLPEIASTYQVAPTQFVEGRMSAPHLAPGESLTVSGDGLPANAHLRFDLQITLVQGASEFTPQTHSPTDMTLKGRNFAGLA